MSKAGMMGVRAVQAELWKLNPDRKTVRFSLPALPVAGNVEPLNVQMDFDAPTVEAIIDRLTQLRARMLPPPTRN